MGSPDDGLRVAPFSRAKYTSEAQGYLLSPKGSWKPFGFLTPASCPVKPENTRALPGDDKQHVAVFDQSQRAGLRRGHRVDIPPAPDEPLQSKDPILAPEIRIGSRSVISPRRRSIARHDAIVAVVASYRSLRLPHDPQTTPATPHLPGSGSGTPRRPGPRRSHGSCTTNTHPRAATQPLRASWSTRAPCVSIVAATSANSVRCSWFAAATALAEQHLHHRRPAVIFGNLTGTRQHARLTTAAQGHRFDGHVSSSGWRVFWRI